MTQSTEFGGKQGFGQTGAPGAISPFIMDAARTGAHQSGAAMANRYAQLGLSSVGATPAGNPFGQTPGGSPGGLPGGVGVGGGQNWDAGASPLQGPGGGSGPATLGGPPQMLDAGNAGAGMPTAELMDLGFAPSLTGGIPAQFEAMLGQLQTEDLSLTTPSGSGGGGKGGGGKGGLGALGGLAKMGGK